MLPLPPLDDSDLARFRANLWRTASGCLEWQGGRDRQGYGRFVAQGRWLKAHRVAAALAGAEIRGLCVLHACDNPPCCEPSHLFLGTKTDNAADRDRKGRTSHSSKLTDEHVAEICALVEAGMTHREVAARYDVTRPAVSMIVARKRRARR